MTNKSLTIGVVLAVALAGLALLLAVTGGGEAAVERAFQCAQGVICTDLNGKRMTVPSGARFVADSGATVLINSGTITTLTTLNGTFSQDISGVNITGSGTLSMGQNIAGKNATFVQDVQARNITATNTISLGGNLAGKNAAFVQDVSAINLTGTGSLALGGSTINEIVFGVSTTPTEGETVVAHGMGAAPTACYLTKAGALGTRPQAYTPT